MSYQVLARKWRPQDFSELVGQEPIVTALRNALREGRVAQAYLFSGIRGVGKTTTARVLAKALNCERGPDQGPCPDCRPCIEITAGSDLDVIEVDAATYSKVEQVRELTESLRYGPARDRYKVVVIDEIHRLSRQAFDALLKIVEEPPPHLTFIFATTEIEAVPATILSRCQEFHFRRVPAETLAAHLRKLSEAESIEASDTALRLIARAGDGSVRDSVALLDQLATFGNGAISDEDAVRLLGGLDTALFEALLEAIVGGHSAEVSTLVRRVEDEGWDPRNVFSQFLRFCRDALHLAQGADPELIDLPRDQTQALAEKARATGFENLLRLLNQLLQSEQLVRTSEAGILALEIALLRATELPKLMRIEDLLGGGEGSGGTGSAPGSGSGRAAGSPSGGSPSASASSTSSSDTSASAGRSASASTDGEAPSERRTTPSLRTAGVDDLRNRVTEVSQSLAAHLDAAAQVEVEGSTVSIVVAGDDELTKDAFGRERNRKILDDVVRELWGASAEWGMKVDRHASSKVETVVEETVSPEPEDADPAAEHPTVQKVLEMFGGTIAAIEPRDRTSPNADSESKEAPRGPA
ncbi:MAG: DNA polymerase III subunit gamma/tau [Acidobacteriota bacterium]